MENINEYDLKCLHELTLKMAETFVNFCRDNNLTCYLCGGGCIGTIRHKGWIPWDDDLDFFMPREDYEQAILLWKTQMAKSRYKMELSDSHHIDGNLFFVIRDSMTTYIKPYQQNMDITQGIVLDVLPLDGYPNGKFERKMQCFWALVYSLYCAQIVPSNHGPLIKLMGQILLNIVPSVKMRYKIYSYAKKKMTQYRISDCNGITELCSGPRYMKNWYPKEAFKEAIFLPFENTKLPVPIGYDVYLKTAFGNYMSLPPKEQQVASHEVIYMDLNTPYIKYRGIKYLLNNKNKGNGDAH